MWQVIKAEVQYNKYLLIAVYGAASLMLIGALIWDWGGVYSVVPNTMVPFFIGLGFLCHKHGKESRERQHRMLPHSLMDQGVARMLFFAIYQSGLFLIWYIAYLANFREQPQAIWMMLSANAMVLTLRALGFVFDDAKSWGAPITSSEGWTPENVARRVCSCVSQWLVILLLLITVASTPDVTTLVRADVEWPICLAVRDFFWSPLGAIAMNLVFAAVFYLSTAVSLPRRVFAGSR